MVGLVFYLAEPLFAPTAVGGGFGDEPRFRIRIGDFLGDFSRVIPFSASGDGDDPPVAELRREADSRIIVSRWRNLPRGLGKKV